MNSKAIGDISQAQIVAALLRRGDIVLAPFGDNQRYDLVVERDGSFVRVQCKTGRLADGAVDFPTCSSYRHRGRGKRDYKGQADVFAIYCPETHSCYWVPVESCGSTAASLRVTDPKNGQLKNVRMAKDFVL